MGNILFLVGITLLLGPQRTFVFFARKQKWRGSAAFWAGVALILMRWTFIGFIIEGYGIFVLFGEYVPRFPSLFSLAPPSGSWANGRLLAHAGIFERLLGLWVFVIGTMEGGKGEMSTDENMVCANEFLCAVDSSRQSRGSRITFRLSGRIWPKGYRRQVTRPVPVTGRTRIYRFDGAGCLLEACVGAF